MNEINILIAVNVEAALTTGDLSSNLYLINDTSSSNLGCESGPEFKTACQNGQVINWSVTSISMLNKVSITGFGGKMLNSKICTPVEIYGINGNYWQGRVEAHGTTGSLAYSITLSLEDSSMTQEFYLEISL